jgi:hypothetical protein
MSLRAQRGNLVAIQGGQASVRLPRRPQTNASRAPRNDIKEKASPPNSCSPQAPRNDMKKKLSDKSSSVSL